MLSVYNSIDMPVHKVMSSAVGFDMLSLSVTGSKREDDAGCECMGRLLFGCSESKRRLSDGIMDIRSVASWNEPNDLHLPLQHPPLHH